MIQALATGCILIAAGWLAFAAGVMAFAPALAQRALAAMASTPTIHFGEHIVRALVGVAMVIRADFSKAPLFFEWGGWFIIASSILIMLAPRRWHHSYAQWWAERIPPIAYRLLALPTLFFAGWFAYASL